MIKGTGKLFPYCQTESLLLQFILQEWLESYSIIQKIKSLGQDFELFEIENLLAELFSPFSHHRSCFDLKEGSLIVLHNYCTLFLYQFEKQKKLMTQASTAVHKGLKEIVTIQEHLFKIANFPLKQDRKKLHLSLEKLKQVLFKTSIFLSKIVLKYIKEENLLLFLVTHKDALQPFFRQETLAFLESTFPSGKEEIKKYIVSRYAKRGFYNIHEEPSLASS